MTTLPLIAVVDDDASALAAMVALVGAIGFRALGFPDATHFLQSDAARQAHAVIADLRMPGLSGLDLCLAVRARRDGMRTILMTAYPDAATERFAREAGIDGYLAKPCDPEALVAYLRSAPVEPQHLLIPEQGLTDTIG